MIEEEVVGVDDSPSGRAALIWAADHARNTHLRLRAVHVITPSMTTPLSWSAGYAGMAMVQDPGLKTRLRDQVASIFQSIDPEPGWLLQHEEGSAGGVLVHESMDARLLVIGTHEHTGIDRFITGSVSHYCLNHAQCPVVAVPAIEPNRELEHLAPKDKAVTAPGTRSSGHRGPGPGVTLGRRKV